MMIKDNRNPKEYVKYKYYRRFDLPIRNVLNKEGHVFGADILDIKTRTLVKNASLINVDFNDTYVDEITEEEFYVLCKELITKSKLL